MSAELPNFDEEPIPGAMPERWETAIEDAAQVVALGLDRAQDLADIVNDFAHGHPSLAKGIGAAVVGAVVGSIIAGRRRPPSLAEQSKVAAAEAAAAAQAAAARLAEETPSRVTSILGRLPRVDRDALAERMPQVDRDAIAERLPRVDRAAIRERVRGVDRQALAGQIARMNQALGKSRGRGPDLRQAQYAAQLVPLAITLLKNPLVRQILIGAASRASRRR